MNTIENVIKEITDLINKHNKIKDKIPDCFGEDICKEEGIVEGLETCLEIFKNTSLTKKKN